MLSCKLRPHHGMCTYFFKGYGYSEEFIKNMTEMVRLLNENVVIELTGNADLICTSCPHYINAENVCCDCISKVSRYDQAVLDACSLSYGSKLPFQTFQNLVIENILSQGKREQICGDCQWSSFCPL